VTNKPQGDTTRDGNAGSGGTDKATRPRLPLPSDRDQAADQQGHPVEPIIEQARKDVTSGQKDTDLRGTAAEKFDAKNGARLKHGTPRTDGG
jgi:hypothetical protein